MSHAYIFPGQGAQFVGMGKYLYTSNKEARMVFEEANDTLGFDISKIMFTGTEEELYQPDIIQAAIFTHSIAIFRATNNNFPGSSVSCDMVAGHSIGEFAALTAAGSLNFSDGLELVYSYDKLWASEIKDSSMAIVTNLEDDRVEKICKEVFEETQEVVVTANYNCPGQLVISGTYKALHIACKRMKDAGAKRALLLPVKRAYHSPLMLPVKIKLAEAINKIKFNHPLCPVYQNIVAAPVTDINLLKENLLELLTGPVRWIECVKAMIAHGATNFTECGPGNTLQGLVKAINKDVLVNGMN